MEIKLPPVVKESIDIYKFKIDKLKDCTMIKVI